MPIWCGLQVKEMAFLNCTDRALSAQTVELFRERPSGRIDGFGKCVYRTSGFPDRRIAFSSAGGQEPAYSCIHPESAVNIDRGTLSSLAAIFEIGPARDWH